MIGDVQAIDFNDEVHPRVRNAEAAAETDVIVPVGGLTEAEGSGTRDISNQVVVGAEIGAYGSWRLECIRIDVLNVEAFHLAILTNGACEVGIEVRLTRAGIGRIASAVCDHQGHAAGETIDGGDLESTCEHTHHSAVVSDVALAERKVPVSVHRYVLRRIRESVSAIDTVLLERFRSA